METWDAIRVPYLSADAQDDKAFVFALLAGRVPPRFETEDPVSRSSHASILGVERLVVVLAIQQLILLLADDEQLLVLDLEETNAQRQIDAHAPVLDAARVAAIEPIGHEDHEQVDM